MPKEVQLGVNALCSNCRFWQPVESPMNQNEKPTDGFCRAYPPVPKPWPKTKNLDWCGNWQIKSSISIPVEKRDQLIQIPIGISLEEAQQLIISETLKDCGGDKERAAQILGVSTRTIYRRESVSKIQPTHGEQD